VKLFFYSYLQAILKEEKRMKKLCMAVFVTILFYAASAGAQSDSDTDADRWKQVKSWKGNFTFTSGQQDDATSTTDPAYITTSTARVNIDGFFTLDQKDTSVSELYKWNGKGAVSGSIDVLLETKAVDGSSDCTTEYKGEQVLAPLAEDTAGYQFQWDFGGGDQGKYFFETGEFMIKDTVTQICDGQTFPPTYQDWYIGGATSINWITLPAAGYKISGDSLVLFNGWNNGHFHWDMEPSEFEPPAPSCAFETAVSDASLLNSFRAACNALAATPAGIELVYRYYTSAAEISRILTADAELRDQFRELIINNAKYAREFSAAGDLIIPCEVVQDVTGFLTGLKPHASPRLDKTIAWLLQGIEDTSLLNALGIRVAGGTSN